MVMVLNMTLHKIHMVSPTKAPLKKPITGRQSILDSKPANEGVLGDSKRIPNQLMLVI